VPDGNPRNLRCGNRSAFTGHPNAPGTPYAKTGDHDRQRLKTNAFLPVPAAFGSPIFLTPSSDFLQKENHIILYQI
jgi:hypothetical protein